MARGFHTNQAFRAAFNKGTTMEALKRYRDWQDARFSKYDSHLAAIADCGWEDDSHHEPGRQHYYALIHFRRCSVILWHDSQGFIHATEYASAGEAQAALDSIRDEYYAEIEQAARDEYPDVWRVCFVAHCGMPSGADPHQDETDARIEVARRLRRLRKIGKVVNSLGDYRWESYDPDDAALVSDDAGFLYIEHIDRSDERDRFLEYA